MFHDIYDTRVPVFDLHVKYKRAMNVEANPRRSVLSNVFRA